MPIVKCQNPECGKEFYARPSRVEEGKGKFCSRECASSARKKAVPKKVKNCQNPECGKEFSYKYNFQKFCCKKCQTYVQRQQAQAERNAENERKKLPKDLGRITFDMPSDPSVTPSMMCPVW